jgi:hypothetical protein
MALRSLLRWFLGSLAVVTVANVAFAVWLASSVDAEYAAGVRTVEQGDSLSIPIAGFFILSIAAALLVNAFVAARAFLRWVASRHAGNGSAAGDRVSK